MKHLAVAVAVAAITISSIASAQKTADWATPAEASNYRTTPDAAATMQYLHRVAEAVPTQVRIEKFGETGEGRELDIVIVSKDGVFDPAKDSCTRRRGQSCWCRTRSTRAKWTARILAFHSCATWSSQKRRRSCWIAPSSSSFPVYNADGHERRSKYNRINQNGPEEMGWRANGQNINLNRDYLKARRSRRHAH